ncbi:hypothetical protein ACGFIG_09445 [Micromonospora sp. NPDC049048]|uniref:hypothetical protein n=1 Tax=Micromonospora sp. NPDC049048 TaxID=3364263 RepID=UPI00371FB3AE
MSDLVIRNDQHLDIPTGTEPATAQLVQWAQAADAAGRFAEVVCNTSAVPQAYRGKPAEAAAAILAGAEVGLSPMASLRAFDNIQGTPAPKAITLRAIAQGLGHEVRIDQSTAAIAVVSGRRKGDTEWQTSTWDLERARVMGLLVKDQWKKQPGAMLVARATAEVCRWIASDAIMGMPYTAEEIRDQGVTVEHRPAPRMVSAADFIEPTDAAVEQPLTAAEVLDEIAAAQTQQRLDEIKALCYQQGHRGQDVRDAWSARSHQLAEAA